ncbi:MAG: HNH endonuclease [Oscillospiraceae bacterium]|nr:HNH endonuclease [Oscillospiraceae bacterium]
MRQARRHRAPHPTHYAVEPGRPEITLNADNLQAVCLECHNTIHYGTGGAIVRGLAFDENGDLRKG